MIDKIKKIYKYLFRDELTLRNKLINMIICLAFLVQFPGLFFTILLGTDIWGILIITVMLVIMGVILILANKFPNSPVPSIIVSTLANDLIFPIMYFTCGGRRTGMICWMLFGAVFTWLVIEGWPCYVISVTNFAALFSCLYFEEQRPDIVTYLETATEEISDTFISFIFVAIIIGAIFKYQTLLYEKQAKELFAKEEELRNLNANLEKMNTELEAASTAKSKFLANMSHEIRTPINAVLGMDEMILRESKEKNILEYATDIDSAGHQLLSLINDILDFSKIESGKMEIHPVEYELFSIINDCFNMIVLRAKRKGLHFSVENNPDIPAFLYGDEVRVRQIIMNLLTNAIKYTKDGEVTLRFEYEENGKDSILLKISVKDTGVGISEENQKVLFESFKRIDEKENRNIEGTGLGLTITKKFVEMMEGTIEVNSVLYEGSTFTVTIPQKVVGNGAIGNFAERFENRFNRPAATNGEEGSDNKKGISFTAPNARVLVVDDVKMNLNVVRLLLKNTEVQIDLAASGEEALKYTMMKRYDVILMDHMMPVMDGIETFHLIQTQADGLNHDTPNVALTANALMGVEEMYLKEGFVSYLSKPVKGVDIEKVLLELLPPEKINMAEEQK